MVEMTGTGGKKKKLAEVDLGGIRYPPSELSNWQKKRDEEGRGEGGSISPQTGYKNIYLSVVDTEKMEKGQRKVNARANGPLPSSGNFRKKKNRVEEATVRSVEQKGNRTISKRGALHSVNQPGNQYRPVMKSGVLNKGKGRNRDNLLLWVHLYT